MGFGAVTEVKVEMNVTTSADPDYSVQNIKMGLKNKTKQKMISVVSLCQQGSVAQPPTELAASEVTADVDLGFCLAALWSCEPTCVAFWIWCREC